MWMVAVVMIATAIATMMNAHLLKMIKKTQSLTAKKVPSSVLKTKITFTAAMGNAFLLTAMDSNFAKKIQVAN